jgi:hypothetical protein
MADERHAEEKPADSAREERRAERKAKEEKGREGAVIVDLGRKSRKDVRQLRKGRGRLMEDVGECIEELREAGAISALAQPVIVIVEQRSIEQSVFPFLLPPGIPAMLPFAGSRRDDDDDDDDDDD